MRQAPPSVAVLSALFQRRATGALTKLAGNAQLGGIDGGAVGGWPRRMPPTVVNVEFVRAGALRVGRDRTQVAVEQVACGTSCVLEQHVPPCQPGQRDCGKIVEELAGIHKRLDD